MTDVFVSYKRENLVRVGALVEALRAEGAKVWWDQDIPADAAWEETIEYQLSLAKAVIVAWSPAAVASDNVRAEARRARQQGRLLQVFVEACEPPLFFGERQGVDLTGWTGDLDAPGWRKVVASVTELTGFSTNAGAHASPSPRKLSICVLPFANMSGDAEQEYFSDGISEDIITDLSKVSALSVVARNTAFTFKSKAVRVRDVARELEVSHVLEGSVRKAGNRVRITAQLIDGAAGDHLWAERWDRDLTDIFALQDEISEAIVRALKLKLLPEEKKAIERRSTDNVEAYNLYLMARQYYVSGNNAGVRRPEAMLRLCRRAVEIDPTYARGWALMASAQTTLHFLHGRPDDGLSTAERALSLDPDLAEAHAVKARYLGEQGRHDEASAEIAVALRLDPESYEVNISAGNLSYRRRRLEDSIPYFEKAAAMMETEIDATAMLISACAATGDADGVRRAARMTLARAERTLEQDQNNVAAIAYCAYALAALGEVQRTRECVEHALLIDPDNLNMRYNFACAVSVYLKDSAAALDLLAPFFARTAMGFLSHAKLDPDLDPIRDDPRFQAMAAAAERRLAGADEP